MNSGKFVLAQLLEAIHPQQFQRCVRQFGGDRKSHPVLLLEPVRLHGFCNSRGAALYHLGLHLCPWARFDFARASLKLHVQLDLRGPLPAAVEITPSRFQEVLWLDSLELQPGAFYLLDRGYTDYGRLHAIEQARAWFIIRARRRMAYARLHSMAAPAGASVRSDQIIQLTGWSARQDYPDKLRRVRCYDEQNRRSLVFLTNHFGLPAATIGQLYRQRWQVELFFKWIKQHLRIKAFFGRSENAVRTQIWVALCVYALVAIARKQAKSQANLFQVLQALSISAFDKTPINELLSEQSSRNDEHDSSKQLTLFN